MGQDFPAGHLGYRWDHQILRQHQEHIVLQWVEEPGRVQLWPVARNGYRHTPNRLTRFPAGAEHTTHKVGRRRRRAPRTEWRKRNLSSGASGLRVRMG
ncbi:hypothetical protein D9M72_575310 [compost metagenome]